MRNARRAGLVSRCLGVFAAAALLLLANAGPASAQVATLEDILSGVVRIKTFINPDGRTVKNLGRERTGTGIVIDEKGLVLTIGYLMVEAHAAEIVTNDGRAVPANIVGYDHDTGFGLLQAIAPLKVKPLALGRSGDVKEQDTVVAASGGGPDMAGGVIVVSKREFAGNWEYLLDEAIFTSPPHPAWSGAALISREGKLVGVGSLIVGDSSGKEDRTPGNMFVPIDALAPILADLIADGRVSGPGRPWLGVTTEEVRGRLFVVNVAPDGPAEKAGLRRGDIIVGIAGEAPKGLIDFYRKIRAVGVAGAVVALDVVQGNDKTRIEVKSMHRLDHLKLKSTF